MELGRWSRRGAAGLMGVVALLAAGCTGGGGGSGAGAQDPVTFEAKPVHVMADVSPDHAWPAAVLHEDTVFLSKPNALVVYDAGSGNERARISPQGQALFGATDPTEYYRAVPMLTEVDGEPTVLVGFTVEPESGATQLDVEIVAVDAATAEVRWRTTFPEPAAAPVVPQKDAAVSINGVERGVAVMSVSHDSATQVTFGLSLADRKVLWHDDDVSAFGLDSGVGAGFGGGTSTVAGVDVETGEQAWEREIDPKRMVRAGPWIVVTTEDDETRLIAIADGTETTLDEGELNNEMSCNTDDHTSVVVCAEDDESALGIDADSGEVLWSDDSWQGMLKGTWRGAVYVDRDDSAVALDARTGEVVDDGTGAAPMVLNDHAGLDQQGTDVQLYPAR
ncbi:PQQ-binding-like beta-propeller repeat protein [Prauserella halophila]|uniref:PQQ-binding-like beta-propeller repeat protein n=1 Tax=Prauserella halophila TaxID=185641 RepID=A0ABN1W5M2_9PSEU|nr:PQQ-binding-like beta-propeller repeat protein [Prauserella halophila]MCP2235745.1 PQQ-like domain-containing protein [Prauserella halophila]